jgi:hypothetical protein
MHIELAATHEAGHSVMQWLVGWESVELQMIVRDSNASCVSASCPYPSLDSLSAVRKRLLVLFAGNASTRQRWPDSNNDWGDWRDVLSALQKYFQRPSGIKWFAGDGYLLRDDTEANDVIQSTMSKCTEIIAHPPIKEAVIQIATTFAQITPDESGAVRLKGRAVLLICESVIGEPFRLVNPWSDWIAGD